MSTTTSVSEFSILQPERSQADNATALKKRVVPAKLRSLMASAGDYLASAELLDAINAALCVGAPLLITGDPGTGKTQAAYYVAKLLGLQEVYRLDVTSETVATDLFYDFDRVAYFHQAQVEKTKELDVRPHIKPGPLWRAFDSMASGELAVVLIDEVDKASRDVPNGLLNALDQYEFRVPVVNEIKRCEASRPPFVVLTSNSEKRLPEPLLRRCIYHYIAFDEEQARKIVEARCEGFPNLDEEARKIALRRFSELRKLPLRKKPATAELLVWLTVLSARRGRIADLDSVPLSKLPALHCLVKDTEDIERLR
jgi:MoxR-like ATPase